MANKELLLVILIVIIVGISIVVAMNVNKEFNNESNKDAIRQEMLLGASNAQSYFTKHTMFGGGQGSFSNITYEDLGIDTTGFNGYYFILNRASESFTISAITRDQQDTISATVTNTGLTWN